MTLQRGDVVLVQFPFASSAATKLRPALVVQGDQNNLRLKNTLVAASRFAEGSVRSVDAEPDSKRAIPIKAKEDRPHPKGSEGVGAGLEK